MPLLATPDTWESQPDYFPSLRYDDPLGQQARFVLLGGYNPVEVCAYMRPGGTMGTVEGTPGGLALLPSSTAITWSRDIPSLDPKTGNSIVFHWFGVLRANTIQTIFRHFSVYGWELKTGSWATDMLQFHFGGVWQGGGVSSAPIVVPDNTLHSITVIVDAPANLTTIYLDGVSVASGAWSGDGGSGFGEIQAGQVQSIVGHATLPHKMVTLQVFTGKFSAGTADLLDAFPFHIFEEEERFQLIPSAGGGPGTTYTLSATSTAFNLSPQAAALRASRKLSADPQTYSLSGVPATLRATRKLVATSNSMALTPYPTALRATRKLIPTSASYNVSGVDVAIRATRKLTATAAAFNLTGIPVNLARGYVLSAASGAYVNTSYAAVLRASRKLAAGQGAFHMTPRDASLVYSAAPPPSAVNGFFPWLRRRRR